MTRKWWLFPVCTVCQGGRHAVKRESKVNVADSGFSGLPGESSLPPALRKFTATTVRPSGPNTSRPYNPNTQRGTWLAQKLPSSDI
ncbi:hypothetical protein Pmani_003651 [Petrolisthes manimaculis]|uniref:Uncharacterized protein n=1 Tax=Petrolisthes manimaculis TaxID=1843537 RepID=A0AAE1QI00_9EUCA|nr:hypothetical protein Pmani_003651 [Petrolisthes manimaculis]